MKLLLDTCVSPRTRDPVRDSRTLRRMGGRLAPRAGLETGYGKQSGNKTLLIFLRYHSAHLGFWRPGFEPVTYLLG